MRRVRRIPRKSLASFAGLAISICIAPPVVSYAGCQQVGIVQLFFRMMRSCSPMFDFHRIGVRPNLRHAVAAKTPLFLHKASAKFLLIAVIVVIRSRGQTMLSEAVRLGSLPNCPHTLDWRNVISDRARTTSGSSEPSWASTSERRLRARSKSSASIDRKRRSRSF